MKFVVKLGYQDMILTEGQLDAICSILVGVPRKDNKYVSWIF